MEELKSIIGTELAIENNLPLAVGKDIIGEDIVQVENKPVYISWVRINIYSLVLNWGFKCACYLLDENQITIKQQDITIEGEEYNNWTDDSVMTDLILEKLGLTKKVKIL
jgi:hypothetical protein